MGATVFDWGAIRSGKPTSLAGYGIGTAREFFPTIANGTDAEHDLDIGAARIWVIDSGGNERLVDFAAETIAIDGAGLDTGTVANNTWYYIWAFYNPATDDSLYLLSASGTAPTAPSGYTYRRFLCDQIAAAVLTDGSTNILAFRSQNKWFRFLSLVTELAAQVTTVGSTSLVVSVPDLVCKHVSIVGFSTTNMSGSSFFIMRHADSDSPAATIHAQVANLNSPMYSVSTVAVDQSILYRVTNDLGTAFVSVLTSGYEVM